MKSLLILFFLGFSSNSNAYFSEESKNIILNGKYNFSNSWVGTVWSSCWARKFKGKELAAEHVVAPVESEGFHEGHYLTNFLINRGEKGKVRRAPVTFIINGIFGEPVSGLVKQVAIQLLERGHHVVGLGNPLGTWGLKQKPTYTAANFVEESQVYLDIMNKAYGWLDEKGLTNGEVHLVGVSYGGFISGIIKSLDKTSRGNLINGMTTLLSPPLKMGPALRNMDHALFQTKSLGKMPDWVLALVSLRFCALPPRRFVDPVQLNWAKALFGYYGFQRSLADSTILMDELYDLGKVPTDKKVRKMWRRTFTFSDYIAEYANDLGELMDSSYGELYYWLDQVPEEEVQIFASLDDPLNEEVEWPSGENTFLIDYGGHYGLRAFKFFDEFLYSVLGD